MNKIVQILVKLDNDKQLKEILSLDDVLVIDPKFPTLFYIKSQILLKTTSQHHQISSINNFVTLMVKQSEYDSLIIDFKLRKRLFFKIKLD
jgi:hypothetical protein